MRVQFFNRRFLKEGSNPQRCPSLWEILRILSKWRLRSLNGHVGPFNHVNYSTYNGCRILIIQLNLFTKYDAFVVFISGAKPNQTTKYSNTDSWRILDEDK